MISNDEKTVYYAPLRYKTGEYRITELDRSKETIIAETLKRTYHTVPQKPVKSNMGKELYDYIVLDNFHEEVTAEKGLKLTLDKSRKSVVLSVYENELYHHLVLYDMKQGDIDRLTAVYDENCLLKNIGISEADRRRFLYIRIDDHDTARSLILHCAKKIGRTIAEKVLLRRSKGRARRLFAEYYICGQQLDYHVIYATEEEVRAVWDEFAAEYGVDGVTKYCNINIHDHINNSGEYSHDDENLISDSDRIMEGGIEHLGLLLACVPNEWHSECFELAIATLDGCMEEIVPLLDRTDDFKFISEQYD